MVYTYNKLKYITYRRIGYGYDMGKLNVGVSCSRMGGDRHYLTYLIFAVVVAVYVQGEGKVARKHLHVQSWL